MVLTLANMEVLVLQDLFDTSNTRWATADVDRAIDKAVNELKAYDGSTISTTGQAFRDALRTNCAKTAQTITFKDPTNMSISVYFDNYDEKILNLKSQVIALSTGESLAASYEVTVDLIEA